MDEGDNLAFHLIQSFKPGEVDAETAHRLGQQFADEVLKGKYGISSWNQLEIQTASFD